MALNVCTRILRRKEFSKFGLHNAKYVTLIKNPQTSFVSLKYQPAVFDHLPKLVKYYSVKALEQNDCDYRNENNITIVGEDIPSPYTNIETCDFPDYIKKFLTEQGFTKPTIIQAQAWPIALQNKNFVGIAQTGTGKTLAFLLPAVVHIKEKASRRGKGPIVLVLAPTRELARQIEQVAKDFERLLRIRCVCIYGGASRARQMAQLQAGVDIVIATPGRLNDFLTSKETSLGRCSYVVLDEADRMLDMGFEPQIRQILEEVPLERQMMMFSATWPKEVRHLAKDFLGEYVQVNVGSTELSANHNIKQHVHICDRDNKLEMFKSIMHDLSGSGFSKMLVFANTKKTVDFLTFNLKKNGWFAVGIHGDKTQLQRDIVIHKFKTGSTNILVATDVAARGLDVDGVSHVINYDFPNSSEDYIHRIGRTGRSGNKGEAHALLTEEDGRLADTLIAVMKEAQQEIPQELIDLAENYDQAKLDERQAKYRANRMNNRSFNPNRSWNSNNWNTSKNWNSNKNWDTNKNWNSNNSRNNYYKRKLRDDDDY